MQRNDKCFCGSGLKYKKCHCRINSESKLAKMYMAYNCYDMACKEYEICNTCINECAKCCSDFFLVNESEFLMILEDLIHRNVDISEYVKKAKEVLEKIKERYPKLVDTLEECMPTIIDAGLDSKYFEDAFDLSGLPKCIFLDNRNKCSIYKIRPIICRGYGTTETCKYTKNPKIEIEEKQRLMEECLFITNSKMERPIVKRPYPLFYWFACFLDKQYCKTTIERLNNCKNMKLDDYYKYESSFIR